MKTSYLTIISILISWQLIAQNLDCNVTVNADQIPTQDRRIFQDMEVAIENFMNDRDWTSDNFQPVEKIKCTLSITLTKMPSIGSFTATVQIRSARPIYNTTYESLILNFADDKWAFEYIESMPLQFVENDYSQNLTSMLAYYAYLILGLDYDTFSELGGSGFYQQAQNVVTAASQSNKGGWNSFSSTRNRGALINDVTNQRMESLRIGLYNYHRRGLDVFENKPEECRKQVLTVLQDIKKIKDVYPSSIFVISFFDAKSEELVDIFSDGNMQEKRDAYNLLIALNPNKVDIFSKIME